MCKSALGVKKFCTDSMAKAELGMYPIYSHIVQTIYSYWHHINLCKDRSLLQDAIIASKHLAGTKTYSYISRLIDLSSIRI